MKKVRIILISLCMIILLVVFVSSISLAWTSDVPGMTPAKMLRLEMEKGTVVAPFCPNAISAMVAEDIGFKAVYMTGGGVAAMRGFNDTGYVTQTEMAQNAKWMVDAVNIPVICDADTGYGNAMNLIRTIQDYEAVGVAGCHIEDQVMPKKCGFFAGKEVVSLEEFVGKIKAAVYARKDPDFLIIARCDALAITGWDDVVLRCRAYMEAGADMIFVDGIKTLQDAEDYVTKLGDLPLFVIGNIATTQKIAEMGFKINICGGTNNVIPGAVWKTFRELMDTGTTTTDWWMTKDYPGSGPSGDLLGMTKYYELEKEFTARGN